MGDEREVPGDAVGPQAETEPNRQRQPVDAEQPPRLPFPVVGIGASAGGLEAVGEFLDAMRPDGGMAFVLVQHLPPDRESMMAEILSRRTDMPVAEVEDGMAVRPDHLYVIRPGHRLTIRDGRLHLGPQLGTSRASNRPIDDFFKSLAEEQRERAIAIVMSGMGSNGAAGAQAIKAVGGLCIAQDPDSAQFPSMPRHLIDAGYADYILRPADLPEVILAYADHPYVNGGREADAEVTLDRERQHLREILAILRTRTGKDFSGYKKPTLLRRVQRRMGLARLETLVDYARMLRQGPSEVTALADDLLIHVTGFFRDPEVWEVLRQKVIAPLVKARESGASVRAWVTACSSGEEAYSLAMLLVEEAERVRVSLDIKVFATDLADRTLAQARAGIYPGGIESEIPPERLGRFFTREDEDGVYRVRPQLRDRVVFAPQNILQDPPFSRLDIAACRNLLIYLEPEVQQRVLGLLHFGLREGGALFLGSSETVAGAEEMFEPVDKKARIFRRVGPTRHGAVDFPMPPSLAIAAEVRGNVHLASGKPRPWMRREGERHSLADLTRRTILEAHTPPAVTVERDGRIVFYHGDTRPFLQQLTGEPTRELMLLAREGVRGVIRSALNRAVASNERASATDGWVDLEPGHRSRVAVAASPLISDDSPGEGTGYFVVSFEQWGEFAPTAEVADRGAESVDELRRLRAELQGTIEELQTSNEELKASHEEVVSVNEEYQSANEELETSKEEMQSFNEELTTVNAQLRAKTEELQGTSGDLASLLASTDIAVLFLDTQFRIRRYTAAIRELVDLIVSDVGRPLSALARRFDDPHLDDDARSVLEQLVPIEREVSGSGDRHFLRRILPYRTTDNRIDGVVITFVDITARMRTEEALRASQERLRQMLDIDVVGVLTFDEAGTMIDANDAFLRASGYTRDQVVTRSLHWRTMTPPEYVEESERNLQQLKETGRLEPYEKEYLRRDGSRSWMLFAGASLGDGTIVEYCIDIAASKVAEAAVRERDTWLRGQREALEATLNEEPLATSLAVLVRTATDALGEGTRAAFYLVDDGGASLHHVVGMPAEYADAVDGFEIGPESLAYGLATYTNQPVLTRDVAEDPRWELWRGMAERFDYRGCWSFPIHSSVGKFVGTLAIYSRRPREATSQDLELASLLTHTASIIISRQAESDARRRAERALRESEDRLRLALLASRMGSWTWDVAADLHRRDANLNALLGLDPVETVRPHDDFLAHMHPDDRERVRAAFEGSAHHERPVNVEFRVVHPDGAIRWLRDQGDVFGDAGDGRARRLAGVCVDVTDLKEPEEALRRSRDELEVRVSERTDELDRANAALRAALDARTELLRKLVTAQEDERRRVARDLHDGLGQELTALILGLGALGRAVPEGSPGRDRLREVEETVSRIGREAHDLAVDVRPTALDDLGLAPALSAYIGRWSERTKVVAEFQPTGLDGKRFPPEIETTVYRIVQEALNNVARHARAERVSVILERQGSELTALVEDNGQGFDSTRPGSGSRRGLGLLIMQERISLVGGTLLVESAEGDGATVRARIPLGLAPEQGGDGR